MNQVHLFISGYVQGVGFRAFVKHKAGKLGITGWVRNLSDRRVEVVAQGERKQLEKLITLCQKGPFMAEVNGVNITWEKITELFTTLSILQSPNT